MKSKKIILAGGTGFLGVALAEVLEMRGYEPVILSRSPESYCGKGRAVNWDGQSIDETWVSELDGAFAIVNLAGKNVNCRPSEVNRNEILNSRVDSVKVIGEALREVAKPPGIWVQSGSLAIYGNAGDRICDEAGKVADGYPANVCVEWESALGEAILPSMRWVNLRIGFVLGKTGGALPFLVKLTRFGLGGSIGSGDQYISWIHLDDMLRVFVEAIENSGCAGTYNATAPSPVTNRELMAQLRTVLNRPWSPAAPSFAVKIGAPILNCDPDIALTGRRCMPARLLEEGFSFNYTDLNRALEDMHL